jgi:hypothetical protein
MASYTGELQRIFLMLLNTLLILARDEWHKCWNEMNVEVTCERREAGCRGLGFRFSPSAETREACCFTQAGLGSHITQTIQAPDWLAHLSSWSSGECALRL